jgi:hypothetical protein
MCLLIPPHSVVLRQMAMPVHEIRPTLSRQALAHAADWSVWREVWATG